MACACQKRRKHGEIESGSYMRYRSSDNLTILRLLSLIVSYSASL